MQKKDNAPTADRLLRLLADLYADQCGVKVAVEIVEGGSEGEETEDAGAVLHG